VVRRLVLISTAFKRSGIHPEYLAGMDAMSAETASAMLETPMYQFYASVAPNLENWPSLVGKVGDLQQQDYDWSERVTAITAPTLIIAADNDFILPTQPVELYQLLGGGVAGGMVQTLPDVRLAVLPNTIHFDILYKTNLLLPVIAPFLDAPPAAA
jgi:pimeloyl-ACP methyl ester carboxylesterase